MDKVTHLFLLTQCDAIQLNRAVQFQHDHATIPMSFKLQWLISKDTQHTVGINPTTHKNFRPLRNRI